MAALQTLKVFISCVLFLFCFPISMKGEVVHITVLTVGYTAIETADNVQYQCYRSEPDKDATLSFGRSAPITTHTPPPEATNHPTDEDIWVVRFSNHGDTWHTYGFGPFYCEAAKDARDVTRVTTFFQRSDAKFIPSGGVYTKTVNVNDTGVVISMTNRYQPDDNGNVITWRKDGGDVLTQFEGQTQISFPNPIQISDQGIYEIYYDGERSQNRGGIHRLIVRECPAGKWGPPECYGTCDNCYNGGVCDDKSGLCICPNNFMGDNCLSICSNTSGNRFGLECEYRCSYRVDYAYFCRGNLFCLPNPYGCSCDVGSRGLACDSDCDVGTYGPGCLQACHCANVSSCNSFSGICTTGGCQSGWSGNNCQIPDICEAGYYGSQCTDKCHCMDDVSCDKTTGACPQKCALGYSVRDGQENCQECEGGTFGLNCLQQCHCAQEACEIQRGLCNGQCLDGWIEPYCQRISRYEVVRVNPYQPSNITCYAEGIPLPDASSVDLRRRIDTNTYNITGITKRSSSVSASELAVHFDIENVYPPEDGDIVCGLILENQFYPTSITNATYILPVITTAPSIVSTTSTTVSIQWNAWFAGEDIGDPPLIGYDVFVRKDGKYEMDHRVDDCITSATVSNLTPDTDNGFRVAAVREGEGGTGPWSPMNETITLCTAPRSPPAGIQVTANNPKELEVTWEFLSLESANCRSGVTHYMIYYALSGSSSTNSRIVSNDTNSDTITGLETYLDYTIQISASNKNEEGDKSSETIGRTLEEVAPAPINVAIPRSTESSFTVSWSTPLPSNVNGRIQMYTIRFKPSDQGDDGVYRMENVLTDALEGEHNVTNLPHGLNYTVQVQTVNGAGSSKWSYPVRAKTRLIGHHCNGAQVGTIIAGVSIPLIIIIIFLIILNFVTYRRAKLRHPVTASPKNTAREPSPRYENPAFDASTRTCKNMDKDTYQDLDIDTRDYQNLSDPHTYQELKNTSIDTSHQSVSHQEPEITYEYI